MGDERAEVLRRLIEYQQAVLNEDGKSIHHRGWDAADSVGGGNKDGFQFPHFTCVMRECEQCPKYTIPRMEVNCNDLIRYNIFESFYGCNNHGFDFIQIQEHPKKTICTVCENMTDAQKEKLKKKPKIFTRKMRARVSEPIKIFQKNNRKELL